MKTNRLKAIDAARGTAMLFVFLSHFTEAYYIQLGPQMGGFLYKIAKLASPTFLAVSGIMLGYLYQINKDRFEGIRQKLIDRGLFLIIIGHFLIFLAHIPMRGGISGALRSEFITDTIGICIILGPLLIGRISGTARLLLGTGLITISWVAIGLFKPENYLWESVKDTLFGPSSINVYRDNFPILPWFGFYLINSLMGMQIAICHQRRNDKKITRILFLVAIFGMLTALALKVGYNFLIMRGKLQGIPIMAMLLSPGQKLPPSPVYFLFYGGGGYMILYGFMKLKDNLLVSKIIDTMSILGKNSLFVFVFQYFIFFSIFYSLKLPYTTIWPIFLIISGGIIFAAAYIWDQKELNRLTSLRYIAAVSGLSFKNSLISNEGEEEKGVRKMRSKA